MTNKTPPIYLRSIGVTNFRAYGPDFLLELPPGPGVTILFGPNGLGKTTLFEATEWALTGTVARLFPHVRNEAELELALTSKRKGVAPGSHSVRLEFTSGDKVVRGPNTTTGTAAIIDLLTAADWQTPIANLATYLALTHFVPQSQREQFLHREIKEQWEMLKLPAGAEEVEKLRLLLGNPGTSRAFNAAVEAAAEALDEQRRVRVEFDALAAELERLRALANAGESLPPDDLRAEVLSILQSLPGEPLRELPEPEPLLALAGEALSRSEVGAGSDALRVAPAETLLRQWNDLREKLAERAGRQAALDERLSAGQTAVADMQNSVQAAQRDLQPIENQHAAIADRADALGRVINAMQLRDELASATAGAAERLRVVAEKNAAQVAERERLEKSRAERQQVVVQGSDARRGQEYFTEKRAAWTAWQTASAAALEATQKRDAAQAQIAEQQRKSASAADRAQACRERIVALQGQLEHGQQTAREIDQAVSVIAARLTTADTRCPVCTQTYLEPGELKRLATQTASLAQADFPALLREIDSQREQVRIAEAEGAAAETECRRLSEGIASYEAIIRDAAEKGAIIEKDEALRGVSLQELHSFIETRLRQFGDLASAAAARLGQFESAETLEAKLRESDEVLARLAAERTGAQRTAAELEQRGAQTQTILAVHQALIEETGDSLESLRAARDASLQRLESLSSQLTQMRSELAATQRQLQELTSAAASMQQQRNETAARLSEVTVASEETLRQWNDLHLSDAPSAAPSESELVAFQRAVTAKNSKLSDLRERHQRALAGFERWRNNQQLTATEERLRGVLATSGAENPDQHRTSLETREDSLRQQLAKAERARQLAGRLKDTMQQEAESYTSTVLEPLGERISALHAMLSPSHEFAFGFNVRQHRSRTDFRFHMSIAEDGEPYDPYLRLSEGQLSALNLTVLLAASTAYRWSRWRALLLDDPLQQNDLIHAAAFLDVLRGLVKHEGYQVILSTHDVEHANFIDRKCRSAGIPVQRCWLLGGTENGVRYRADTLLEEVGEFK